MAAAADGTSAEIDRDVTLYGYVRGTHLQPHHRVHLIGEGTHRLTVPLMCPASLLLTPCCCSLFAFVALSAPSWRAADG